MIRRILFEIPINMSVFAKIIGNNHGNYPYRLGLNSLKYNNEIFDASPHCVAGGLYYCKLENILDYSNYGHTLCFVSIPDDAQVVQIGNKFKTDRFVIDQMFDLRDAQTWEFFEHVVITDETLCSAVQYGYLHMAKFLVARGADIHAGNDSALRLAALYGHLDIVQFVVDNDSALHAAVLTGNKNSN